MKLILFTISFITFSQGSLEYLGAKKMGLTREIRHDLQFKSDIRYNSNITELDTSYFYLSKNKKLGDRTWNADLTQVYLFNDHWGLIGEYSLSGNYDKKHDLQRIYGLGISHYYLTDSLSNKIKLSMVKNKIYYYNNSITNDNRLKLKYQFAKHYKLFKLGIDLSHLTKYNNTKYTSKITPSTTLKVNKYIGLKAYHSYENINENKNYINKVYGFRITIDF